LQSSRQQHEDRPAPECVAEAFDYDGEATLQGRDEADEESFLERSSLAIGPRTASNTTAEHMVEETSPGTVGKGLGSIKQALASLASTRDMCEKENKQEDCDKLTDATSRQTILENMES